MKKVSRESWIQAGFQTLDQLGYSQLSAEKIARRLHVTRGSFYHHFRSRAEFVDALLVRWRQDYTTEVIAQASAEGSPQRRLERYLSVAARLQPGREVAIRAWAARDRTVLVVLEQTDAARLEFVRQLGRDLFPCAAEDALRRFARLACLAFIGFQQTGPHGRERFVALVQDVLGMLTPSDTARPKPAPIPGAAPRSAEAPARRLPPAGRPGSDAGRSR
jgi:AcrR family transcriptional regulator